MKNSWRSFVLGISLVFVVTSLSLHAKIDGTYVLEGSEKSRFQWKQPELTIKANDEGEYSATLSKETGEVLLTTQDVEVDDSEFTAVFTMSSDLGDLDITFTGIVVDGKITGTISESMFSSEVKLVANRETEEAIPLQEDVALEQEDPSPVSVSSTSQSINPEIVGTYLLDVKSNTWKRRHPELTINRDDEGEYSASLNALKVTETNNVSGEGNEFKATFTISTNMGDMDLTYAGRVEQGKLSGTITESMFDTEVELVGKLKKEN